MPGCVILRCEYKDFAVIRCRAGWKIAGFEVFYTDVYAGGARFYLTARKGERWARLNVLSDYVQAVCRAGEGDGTGDAGERGGLGGRGRADGEGTPESNLALTRHRQGPAGTGRVRADPPGRG
jgi:hypothetical protein